MPLRAAIQIRYLRTRSKASVPAAISTAARPKPKTGETTVYSTPTTVLETNLLVPLTVPSAP